MYTSTPEMDDGCLTLKSKDRPVGSNPTCFAIFNINLKTILEIQAWDDEFYAAMFEKFEGYGEAFGDFLSRKD